MKALVTGGTGFVGSHLVESLLQRGDDVTCLVRPISNRRWLQNLPVKFIEGDLQEISFLKDAVKGFDYIYHIAGLIKAFSYDEYEKANATLTKNLGDAIIESNPGIRRLVYLSSLAAAGPADDVSGISEDDRCRPVTDYGLTKLKGEEALKTYSSRIPITILRPPPVYGPRDDGLLLYFKTVSYGFVPYFKASRQVSLVYVNDLVEAIINASRNEAASGNTYFIANEKPYAINYLAKIIKKAVRNNKISCPLWLPDVLIKGSATLFEMVAYLSGQQTIFNRQKARELTRNFWVCRVNKAGRDFGWTARTTLEDGVEKTAAWYRQHKWI
ncbi:MAG: NAD(P)-dependent oxidoreductase [Candidatus Brocadiia bacterium]